MEPVGTPEEKASLSSLELLLRPTLGPYILSRLMSGAGLTLLRATVAWQVYAISGSAFYLGLIGIVQFLPAVLFGLIGGAVADTGDRKRIVMVSQLAAAACAGLLMVITRLGNERLPVIFVAVFLIAIASAFENPARSALLPQLVSAEEFPRTVSLYTAISMFAFMSGPVLMGFLIDLYGVANTYGAFVALQAVSFLLLLFLRTPRRAVARGRAVSWAAIKEGVAFVWRQPVVLGCMTLDMFAVLFGGATALLPIYANDILEVGPRGYGILSSSLEIGAVTMAILLLVRPQPRRTGLALLFAVVGFGAATVVFGLSRWFPLSIVAYMGAGMSDYVSMVMRGTAIQLSTPDELRGRVSSVNMMFIGASNQLGAAESGFVAALTSPTFSVVSGGIGALIVTALVAWKLPQLRAYRAV